MKKSLAVMLALIMVLCMIPTTAFAEAGDWDPLTDPNTVAGSLVERKTFSASTTMEAGKDGYLRLMPTLDAGNNSYNAMAYCGATATSNNTSIAEVKSIEIGKWVGGVWNNADCLQVTVNPKAAGTTTVVINFYYTFSQSPNPLTNPNAKWFYGTSYYTINVTEPTKPNPPTPENTSKPVAGLTGEEAVKVHCTNSTANHADKSYGLKPNSYTVSEVEGNATNGYTCTITVKPGEYVNAYNEGHALVDPSQRGTITLKWDGSKWKVDSGVPVVFDVKCETQEPPTPDKPNPPTPENTSKPFIELTGKEAVKVHCTNDKANHDDKSYGLMHDGYTVGDVEGNATSGYTCDITVKPEKYVEAYNSDPDINVEHKLDPESQTGTIHLKYDEQGWMLADPSGVPVVFDVKCDNTQPPLDPITIEVSKVWNDDSGTAKKPEKITVLLLANGQEVKNATIKPNNEDEDTWFYRFDNMPANDINGKPINYTVKEKDVPGWTPYYYTAGPNNGKPMIFYIYNVPTVNTREIKVTKTVSGEGADKAKYFDFKVTLLEYHESEEVTHKPGYYPLSGTYTFGGVTFTNGEATFKLKHGESFTITGIPTHIYSNLPLQYKVEEIAPNGYTVKVNDSAGSSINGDFAGDKTVNIAFENVKESGTNPTPTPTPTPGGGNGGGGHYHPTTPVPVIVIPPKTGDMTIWQSILHFLGIR